jgi:hypothetical protein
MNEEYMLEQCSDDRVWESNVEDIDGGDNFADFCEEFFEILDEEEYWES